MPTPRATRGGSSTELAYNLGGSRSDEDRSQGRVLLPTPQVADATGGHATRSGARSDEKLLPGVAVEAVTDWGPYAPAVERWERITRPAPSPVRMDGKGGRARLSPELPEWMMGWPAGWVTDPAIGLSRAAQLKAAGNGVCPQQAAVALREMLARPGVPAIEWGLAA
jgi:DNA (cytosine-5)-methyltransferase 1